MLPCFDNCVNDILDAVLCQDQTEAITSTPPAGNPTAPVSAGGAGVMVRRTIAGHQFVEDNTLGNERIKTQHALGSYEEFTNDGRNLVVKGESYSAIFGPTKVHIFEGNAEVVVGGAPREEGEEVDPENIPKMGLKLVIEGDLELNIGGKFIINCKGDMETTIEGSDERRVDGDYDNEVFGKHEMIVHQTVTQKYMNTKTQTVTGNYNHTQTGGNFVRYLTGNEANVVMGARAMYTTGGPATLTGDTINFSSTTGTMTFHAPTTFDFKGTNIVAHKGIESKEDIYALGNMISDKRVQGTDDVIGGAVSLRGHIHIQGAGFDNGAGGVTQSPLLIGNKLNGESLLSPGRNIA